MEQHENPIVFISYSQDTVAFADKVLAFSNKLRGEGIDAILDQYEEAPPEGWPRWMENSINKADYVIVVGSKGYYDKIYGNVDPVSYTHLSQRGRTGTGTAGVPGPARRVPRFSLVTGLYFRTNLADEISTKINFLPAGMNRSVSRSCGWRTRQIGWQCTLSVSPSPIGKSADLAMAKAGRIRWIFPARGRRNWSKRGCEENAGHTAF